MKIQTLVYCITVCFITHVYAHDNVLSVSSGGAQAHKAPLLIGRIGALDAIHNAIVDELVHHVACAHQTSSGFAVHVVDYAATPNRKAIRQLVRDGYPLALFVSGTDGALEWRLYDATTVSMLAGKKVAIDQHSAHQVAECVASSVWKTVLHENSLFGSKIAYCKERTGSHGKRVRSICSQRACGLEVEEVEVNTPSIKCGLRWHPDADKSLLYYSECTATNVRLMSVNGHKHRSMFANLDGLTMEPSFSYDGLKMVMSASSKGNSHIYYGQRAATHEPWRFTRLTHHGGNNISPVLLDDGDVIFCSDFEQSRPHIYKYDHVTGTCSRISSGLSSTSPAVCPKRNKLAYSKVVDGMIQLWIYDFTTGTHEQLTHDTGDKEESSWSPCGNYLAFSYDTGDSSRIGVLSMVTNERWFITPRGQRCSHPAWSPHTLS